MFLKITYSLILILPILLSSCASEVSTDQPNEEFESESKKEQAFNQNNVPDSWAIYSGHVGLYGKHVIIELAVYGDSVKGTYFYSKHQKPLTLIGTIDSKNHIKAKEMYKNKTTGYWEFNLSKGDIVGTWSKSESMIEPEGIIAKLCDIERQDYQPEFETYQDKHIITFYNGVDDDEEEVMDECKINWIDDKHFTFYYNVIRRNGHLGSIEGLAKIEEDGKGIFRDDESCELTFLFDHNTLEIAESQCDYYHGANAYFDGVLQKVK